MKKWNFPTLILASACALMMSACFDDSPAGPPPPPRDRGYDYDSNANHRDRYWRSSSSEIVSESSASKEKFGKSSSSVASKVSSSSVKPKSSSSVVAPKSSSSVAAKESSSSVAAKNSSSSETSKVSSSSEAPVSSSSVANSSSSEENWRETCLDIINAYRATEDLAPLALANEEKQACTDTQAGYDLSENSAHGHFGICGENAQNTGPNVRMNASKTYGDYAEMYLKMMWEDEKALVTSGKADPAKDSDYQKIGHYLNMKGNYKSVACGFAVSSSGKTGWLNINFFR